MRQEAVVRIAMTDKEKNLETIRQRKKIWIGHVLRGYGLFRNVLEERMLGKKFE